MSELLRRQLLFGRLLPRLLNHILDSGFQYKLGEALRPPYTAEYYERVGKGTRNSLHCQSLAIDLLLFTQSGEYLTMTEDYRFAGEWWEQQHELCRWGGRFGDGNHFSIAYGGRK